MSARPESIDAHQHFWKVSRGDYGWLKPEMRELHRDFGPGDLAPHLLQAGVSRTILVQAAPTFAETRFLLEIAESASFVAGVVGWIPMDLPEGAALVERSAAHPKFVGVRPMIQDIKDASWMLGRKLEPAFRALEERGLAFDALVRPKHLPHLIKLLRAYPNLRVVIDHAAKPEIGARGRLWSGLAAWKDALTTIARESTAFCKLSGLVTEAPSGWCSDDLKPYVEFLLERFGPRRLIWGSDWPVVNLAGGYAAWREASEQLLAEVSPPDRSAIFGGNAFAFYRLRHDPVASPAP